MTFIAEYAPDRRRGLLGSMLEVGTFTGYLLGASLATIMSGVLSPEAMLAWGWRVPFYVALPLGVVGLYLRSKLDDPPPSRPWRRSPRRRRSTAWAPS